MFQKGKYLTLPVCLTIVFISGTAWTQERGMGDGTNAGDIQQLASWSNESTKFASESGEWSGKYNSKTVRRKDDGSPTAEVFKYCLGDAKEKGARMLKDGNRTSLSYEAYLAKKPNDGAVRKAYNEHEANLQKFNRDYQDANSAAKCN